LRSKLAAVKEFKTLGKPGSCESKSMMRKPSDLLKEEDRWGKKLVGRTLENIRDVDLNCSIPLFAT